MTPDENDEALLRLYRDSAHEWPDAALDRQVLKAARAFHARRWKLPLILTAASMAMALFTTSLGHSPVRNAAVPDTSTFGMVEGRITEVLSDPQTMQQMAIRQMPGGSN